jgi:hypothetical protein
MTFNLHTQHSRGLAALALAAATLALGGCFSGDDEDSAANPPPNAEADAVPSAAFATTTAYTDWTVAAANASADQAEPLKISTMNLPPTSDSDEPAAVR